MEQEKFLDITIKTDIYNGIKIDLHHLSDEIRSKLTVDSFDTIINDKIKVWIENGRKCIWFIVPGQLSHLISVLIKHGFEFHHAKPNFVMLVKWIPNEETRIPKFAHTTVGVGGLVYDPVIQKVLLIQEKNSRVKMWKFPGGYSEPGEDIGNTAIREVKEETGIDCTLKSIISFRHNHTGIFGCSDFYFVCLLSPIKQSSKIETCQIEIDDCRWFPLSEARQHLCGFNRYVFEEFLKQYSFVEYCNDCKDSLGDTIQTEIIHSQYGPFKRDERVYSVRKSGQ
ncbi:hypothetical protein DERF_002119 [Dermatophagoides farinae]|uniref:Nucleoside diphosphate-linked moiety X motif 6 n=1 Tax=Dermatophagoides farinae TaxID=6954 RepID=A0A922IDQ3_DERFA|nr:nucleoside diphosphate-linked moiety X motif 6-like [Dermatophagoides farinae]KAH9528150.1 hypothetical protein DERF_002119 [Dermatophagoides farinae]